jgi:hypothetical protein
MRDADFKAIELPPLRGIGRAPMQMEVRLSHAIRQYLDISPAQATNAHPESLRGGFLGREPPGETLCSSPAVSNLAFGVDAIQEPPSPPLKRLLYPIYLDDVDA